MTYAIIRSGGKQYQVKVGDRLIVDRLKTEEGKEVVFPEVLLVKNGDSVEIGTPTLTAKVSGKVTKHFKGEKLHIYKFKAKSHYRRKTGFRAYQTEVQITSIS
ncbi:50S ribosomal protein L21 [Candidatus Gottesmanbacteria bacterium RIFCSPHIGHO2_02_FULL_39_11]|uniref:Large ribosomal subunit protein bL21 n=1 Tax=Candidatus Gottesmanbacteria bacterium RIFCSPHIGHO2_02_FULL_39_11 TaxID=1798382 RepID=A0A1F5ZV88_9BACT|nr:MAG: 50S ribosomal protein L21 [Candidatus Gottesmanbacteria bacterium RIFCSPHIGHO2_02_FULL_39_11]